MTLSKGPWSNLLETPWKLSLTGQWHFSEGSSQTVIDWSMTLSKGPWSNFLETPENCHWPITDTFQKAVLKLSLTGQWHSLKVQDPTFWRPHKIVIDWSMTLFRRLFYKCHWPVNDTFQKAVLKLSLTGQWHSLKVQDPTFWRPLKIVIDRSMTFLRGLF